MEGFPQLQTERTTHAEDARRLLDEFDRAERFRPEPGSEPVCDLIDGVPEIRRYNPPPKGRSS